MKIKFVKNYLSYKADSVETIEDADLANDLISKGYAQEVKEDASVDAIVAELEKKVSEVAEKVAAETASKTVEKVSKAFRKGSIIVGKDEVEKDPQHGFKSFGHYAQAVKSAINGERNETLDRYAKSTGGNETTSADGGYAVPQIWANEIYNDIMGSDSLLSRTRQFPLTVGNILNVPADNTTTLPGNPAASWVGEGSTISPGKPALRNVQLQLQKLALLVATTDELEADAQALSVYLQSEASYQMTYAINNAIVRGNGSSKPTGFIGHSGTVLRGRTTTNLVKFDDLGNMRARYIGSTKTGVWLMNPEVFAQLAVMTSGNYNVFLSNNSVEGNGATSIFGMPIIVSEHMSSLGSDGDIALCDFSRYFTAVKGGIDAQSSIHLYFNTAENAYRFIFRMDGKPARATPLTPAANQGTKTLGNFVVLDDGTTLS
jgi:HK97 family phage major capsid protein